MKLKKAKMKKAKNETKMKKAVFHKKFHFWTRAINQIQNFYKKKIFFEFDQKLFWEGLLIK
jgi:hypothetical protein